MLFTSACSARPKAFSPNIRKLMPGGRASAFCEERINKSIPHSSIATLSAKKALIASTARKIWFLRQKSPATSMSYNTPVEVSCILISIPVNPLPEYCSRQFFVSGSPGDSTMLSDGIPCI